MNDNLCNPRPQEDGVLSKSHKHFMRLSTISTWAYRFTCDCGFEYVVDKYKYRFSMTDPSLEW